MSAVSRVTFYRDVNGKWRWRFVRNGNTMADSGQGYSRRADCIRGAEVVLGGIVDDPAVPTAMCRPNTERTDGPWEYLPVAVLRRVPLPWWKALGTTTTTTPNIIVTPDMASVTYNQTTRGQP